MSAARDSLDAASRLRITEVFHSLQGEALDAGAPTVFIRLTGCPLRCTYCDTTYSFHGGDWRTFDELLDEVSSHEVRHVCVTGGEPLAQPNCLGLLSRLCDAGYSVSLETSGALDIAPVDPRVSRVLDLKTPASGECHRNLWSNIEQLTPGDQVKFVICDREDFEWACAKIHAYDLPARCTVWLSPVVPDLAPRDLADWMLAEHVPARLQLQLHKLIWGDEPGR